MTTKKAQPQKRGAKPYYTGSRLAFLEGYRDEYISLRGKKRQQFWHRLFAEWWEKYPWRLKDHEEPPTNDHKKMLELASVGTDEDLKKEIEAKTRQRMTAWFGYRASVHNSTSEGNVWTPILKRIHNQSSSKPRCRSAAQQLMHEQPTVVDEMFVTLYGDGKGMTRTERLNNRNGVAKQLVATTYQKMIPELEQRAKATHERDLKEWNLEFDHVEEAEDVHLARDSLFSAVHPLLKLIGHYSGCYVTLLAAAPDHTDGKPYFTTVHHFPQDKEMRVNWTEFNEQDFKDGVARPFFKYIRWMEGSNNDPGEAVEPGRSTTAVPIPPVPRSLTTPSTAIPTSQRPGKYKKRTITDTEDTSDNDDTDMNISDNDSSGSSVDSDHVPAKRLRTSTVVTRSSRSAPPSEGAAAEANILQASLSSAINQSSGLDNLNTETGPESEPEISAADTNVPSSDTQPNSTEDTAIHIAPSPCHSSVANAVINRPDPSSGTSDVRGLITTPPAAPPQLPLRSPVPEPDSELEIPDFLTGKHGIHGYLSSVKESQFRDLLKAYITFELANRSDIRGTVPTYRRPKAVKWWSSRARPGKLPPYDSFSSFKTGIIEWWIAIQPDWRKLHSGKVSRHVEGDWERIYQPGVNGLLNIIILAYWWIRILEERGIAIDESYSWFVSDVTWVLSQLTVVAREEDI